MSDATDLLPGLDDQFDGTNNDFVKDYILGNPFMYREEYNPLSTASSFITLPRFSHSSDFSLLFTDTPEDYALGLLLVGVFITSIFVCWCIILGILKCIGPRHVGVFAGFPYKKESWKSNVGRGILSFSSFMIMICTILLVTKGLHELQGLSDTIQLTNNDVQSIETEVLNIVTNIRVVSSKAKPIRDELIDFLNGDICPLQPGSGTEESIRSIGQDTYNALTNLDDFIDSYLKDVSNAVDQTNAITTKIDTIIQKVQFENSSKVTAIMLPYFIIPAFLLIAVCMGWYDVFSEGFYTFITWCILPIMCLLTLAAIVGSGWMAFAIEGNSDFCYPSPEESILDIMNRAYPTANIITSLEPNGAYSGSTVNNNIFSANEIIYENGNGNITIATTGTRNENFAYDVILFYANQCDSTKGFGNPWLFLENHYDDLAKGKNVLGVFLRSIEETTLQQLSQECGQEYAPIVELLKQLQIHIDVLSKTSIRALNLMACQNIVPLYTNAIYDATCTYSIVGATWVFACTVCIAFFGCLCIMFRGAYYPLGYYYYDSGNGDDGEKSLYGTSEENDDESATANGGIGRLPGDEDGFDEDDNYESDLRLRAFDTFSDGSCIEAIASTSMMDAIDVDVYEDGAGGNINNNANANANANANNDNGGNDTDADTLGTGEPLLDKLACM